MIWILILISTSGMIFLGVFSILEHKEKILPNIRILICCGILNFVFGIGCYKFVSRYSVLIFTGTLISAVMMDILWQEIYEFVWIISIVCSSVSLFTSGVLTIEIVLSLAMFFAVQEVVMKYVYGKADCHAFCSCALIMALKGMALEFYAVHMFISWAILVISQLITGNIDGRLKLKKPVPMIPFIAVGFFALFVHFS